MNDSATVGGRLREVRKRRGLTQRDLARESRLSLSLIRKVEQGDHDRVGAVALRKLAVALDVPVTVLLAVPPQPSRASADGEMWKPLAAALFAQVGDFRRGALNPVWRRCGKPNCACAQPGHRGHGPQWNLTRRIGGKTVNVHLKPGPELEKARREVAEHQRFAGLVEEVSAVSEAICAARPPAGADGAPPDQGGQRGGSRRGSRRPPPPR